MSGARPSDDVIDVMFEKLLRDMEFDQNRANSIRHACPTGRKKWKIIERFRDVGKKQRDAAQLVGALRAKWAAGAAPEQADLIELVASVKIGEFSTRLIAADGHTLVLEILRHQLARLREDGVVPLIASRAVDVPAAREDILFDVSAPPGSPTMLEANPVIICCVDLLKALSERTDALIRVTECPEFVPTVAYLAFDTLHSSIRDKGLAILAAAVRLPCACNGGPRLVAALESMFAAYGLRGGRLRGPLALLPALLNAVLTSKVDIIKKISSAESLAGICRDLTSEEGCPFLPARSKLRAGLLSGGVEREFSFAMLLADKYIRHLRGDPVPLKAIRQAEVADITTESVHAKARMLAQLLGAAATKDDTEAVIKARLGDLLACIEQFAAAALADARASRAGNIRRLLREEDPADDLGCYQRLEEFLRHTSAHSHEALRLSVLSLHGITSDSQDIGEDDAVLANIFRALLRFTAQLTAYYAKSKALGRSLGAVDHALADEYYAGVTLGQVLYGYQHVPPAVQLRELERRLSHSARDVLRIDLDERIRHLADKSLDFNDLLRMRVADAEPSLHIITKAELDALTALRDEVRVSQDVIRNLSKELEDACIELAHPRAPTQAPEQAQAGASSLAAGAAPAAGTGAEASTPQPSLRSATAGGAAATLSSVVPIPGSLAGRSLQTPQASTMSPSPPPRSVTGSAPTPQARPKIQDIALPTPKLIMPASGAAAPASAMQASGGRPPPTGGRQKVPPKVCVNALAGAEPLRSLFWDKVKDFDYLNTIWRHIGTDDLPLGEERLQRLAELFPARKAAEAAEVAEQPKKPRVVSLLDAKRQTVIGIAASKLRVNFTSLADMLLSFRIPEPFDEEVLYILQTACPTAEEVAMVHDAVADALAERGVEPDIQEYEAQLAGFGKAEQFVYVLGSVPLLAERLDNWIFKLEFQKTVASVRRCFDVYTSLYSFLAEDTRWRAFLRLVLAVGNVLNTNTPRGKAYGFKFKTLTKLRDMKDVGGRQTLLHYLLDTAARLDQGYDAQFVCLGGELDEESAVSHVIYALLHVYFNECVGDPMYKASFDLDAFQHKTPSADEQLEHDRRVQRCTRAFDGLLGRAHAAASAELAGEDSGRTLHSAPALRCARVQENPTKLSNLCPPQLLERFLQDGPGALESRARLYAEVAAAIAATATPMLSAIMELKEYILMLSKLSYDEDLKAFERTKQILNALQSSLQKAAAAGHGDGYAAFFEPFLIMADKQLKGVQTLQESTDANFKACKALYDEKTIKMPDFLGVLSVFTEDCTIVFSDMEKLAQKAERDRKRAGDARTSGRKKSSDLPKTPLGTMDMLTLGSTISLGELSWSSQVSRTENTPVIATNSLTRAPLNPLPDIDDVLETDAKLDNFSLDMLL